MITEELAKKLIEQAEFNCSGELVKYNIDNILQLREEGAYLVIASSEFSKTSFVCYEDGTAYFLDDWQGGYPTSEEEISYYNNWVTIDWKKISYLIQRSPKSFI